VFRDLYDVSSERSCVNAGVFRIYTREFLYVTSALSNGKQWWLVVRAGLRLQGTFSPSIQRDAAHKCLSKSSARKKLIRGY